MVNKSTKSTSLRFNHDWSIWSRRSGYKDRRWIPCRMFQKSYFSNNTVSSFFCHSISCEPPL